MHAIENKDRTIIHMHTTPSYPLTNEHNKRTQNNTKHAYETASPERKIIIIITISLVICWTQVALSYLAVTAPPQKKTKNKE